ncbi:MAG: hypothetical protein M3T55_01560 [Pseudomonadota bacterium]|nr:hypothetical protein [Pseudomonadota bacterium]
MDGRSISGWLGFAVFLAYWGSYLTFWAYVASIRAKTLMATALPGKLSLFLGTAALGYLWSGRHREANDPALSKRVFAVRITQTALPLGAFLFFRSS